MKRFWRTRPTIDAMAAAFVWETIAASLVAWPTVALIDGVTRRHPSGEQILYRSGGFDLVATLHALERIGAGLTALLVFVSALACGVGVLLSSIVTVALVHGRRGDRLRDLVRPAAERWGTATAIFVATRFAQVAVALVGIEIAKTAAARTSERGSEASGDVTFVVVFLAFMSAVAAIDMLGDAMRCALFTGSESNQKAFTVAANALRRRTVSLIWSWLWRTGLGIAIPLAVFAASARFSRDSAVTLVLFFFARQAALLSRVVLRTSWTERITDAIARNASRAS